MLSSLAVAWLHLQRASQWLTTPGLVPCAPAPPVTTQCREVACASDVQPGRAALLTPPPTTHTQTAEAGAAGQPAHRRRACCRQHHKPAARSVPCRPPRQLRHNAWCVKGRALTRIVKARCRRGMYTRAHHTSKKRSHTRANASAPRAARPAAPGGASIGARAQTHEWSVANSSQRPPCQPATPLCSSLGDAAGWPCRAAPHAPRQHAASCASTPHQGHTTPHHTTRKARQPAWRHAVNKGHRRC